MLPPAEESGTFAALMVVFHDGKVLILRRGRTAPWRPGYWSLPGGLVGPGESASDAAIREAEEEAGIAVSNVQFLGVFPGERCELHVYCGQAAHDHVVIRATDGIIENDAWEWVDESTLGNYPYPTPVIATIIQKGLRNGKVDS
jgi:8-oxo-dGTP pyrophosphatase MutT (NUDIX family)